MANFGFGTLAPRRLDGARPLTAAAVLNKPALALERHRPQFATIQSYN